MSHNLPQPSRTLKTGDFVCQIAHKDLVQLIAGIGITDYTAFPIRHGIGDSLGDLQ